MTFVNGRNQFYLDILQLSVAPTHTLVRCIIPTTYISTAKMENKASGSKTRNTVYVAGLADEVNEQQLLDAFVTFGTPLPFRSFRPSS